MQRKQLMAILRHLDADEVKWPNFAIIHLTSGVFCPRIAVNDALFSLEDSVKLNL